MSDKFEGHTPSPWVAHDRGIGWEIHAEGRKINEDFRETFIRADAELCAAAPELLAENKALNKQVRELLAENEALRADLARVRAALRNRVAELEQLATDEHQLDGGAP